ncbi:MAG: hypothetical protein H6Q30_1836, partial [Bacteroidetes bacterium]|nr:hypothetical protein [Bacteroidota bacterium]
MSPRREIEKILRDRIPVCIDRVVSEQPYSHGNGESEDDNNECNEEKLLLCHSDGCRLLIPPWNASRNVPSRPANVYEIVLYGVAVVDRVFTYEYKRDSVCFGASRPGITNREVPLCSRI